MISPYFLPKFAAAPWLVEAPTTTTLVVVRRRELNTYLPATPSTRKCVLAESSSEGLVEALKRAFVNERCAPELLPHQDDLVNDVKERINEQARAHEAACFPHFPLTLFRPRR